MTQEYKLIGSFCPSCTQHIERGIQALPGVSEASINPITAILHVEHEVATDIFAMVEKIVHQYEPGVQVHKKEDDHAGHTHDHGGVQGENRQKYQLLLGGIVFAIAMVLDQFKNSNHILVLAVFVASYVILGGNVVLSAGKNILRGRIFDENFLMSIATLGAFAIGQYPEAAAVMLFYQIGELFQDMAVHKSKKSIADLMDIRPDYANVQRNGEIQKVDPDDVLVGDTILVKPGEKIPLDGLITQGESMLDTRALTGESVPRRAGVGDTVLSGCINQSGVLLIEVTKIFSESTVAKILDLVENASNKKAKAENFITTFSRYYTPIVVGLAVVISCFAPLFLGGAWPAWINRGLIFLVISCPCALVISIPLGFFGGIGAASKKGILVKGGSYLEALNAVDIVVFDKTGTLTKGVFAVTKQVPAPGFTSETLLQMAASVEVFSNHPIAKSILAAYGKEVDQSLIAEHQEVAGHGVRALYDGKQVLVGNAKLLQMANIEYAEEQSFGTTVYVAYDNAFVGSILISDEVKPQSKQGIAMLKARGISKTVMLTGDNPAIANAVGKELGIDEVYGGLLPDEKVDMVERLLKTLRQGGKLAFVGDGINDAPVLARADIGIAMGALGSDAAIEAADVVLMTDDPTKIATAMDVAKATRRIVWQNIIFALSIKGAFLLLGALGFANMWEAVFADVGVCILAILNASRIMRYK